MRYHELLTASLFQLVARAIAFSGMPPQPSVSTLIKKHATDLLFLKEKVRERKAFIQARKINGVLHVYLTNYLFFI
jgi:hypothetical protein